jgi:hypothetical protein
MFDLVRFQDAVVNNHADDIKYRLGKLCPRAHNYEGTSQSLRYRGSKRCIACDTEDAQARRKAKASA